MLVQSLSNRSILVDVLFILFGISSWISINGLWVELPLMVSVLPESWNLPSYLVFLIQIANVGPIVYSLLRWKVGISNSLCIYGVLSLGVIASVTLIFTWSRTLDIGGEPHSLGLFLPILLLSMVDCTSSVLYFPYVGTFKAFYLNSYLIGEGLSGFLPSLLALFQGVGKTTCENHWNETTFEMESVPIAVPPNFSVDIFFVFLTGMMVLSLGAFLFLDLLPRFTSDKHDETTETLSIVQSSTESSLPPDNNPESTQAEPHSKREIWFLLGAQGFVNFFSNGVLPSIQTYSCLPYGNDIFHFVVTAGPIIGPTVAFIGHFISFKHSGVVAGFISFGTVIMGFLIATAAMSPTTMFEPSVAGPIIVCLWILNGISFSYAKNEIVGICREMKNSDYLFWYGVLTQVGSAMGALVSFVLVSVIKVLTPAEQEPLC
eukprot:TRINITY_DN1588_c0_g1_i2.p1 TRINITY_DN1588_c0_g1~~TRINITY_DN1588_c0_g1_i2.p1  ORF type:complete len:432 (-),score=56.08 TRINITY_DN1588_c0_g1_i2:240-1535(-)